MAEVGFVHASRPGQLVAIRDAFYSDVPDADLVALELDLVALGERGIVVVEEPGDPREPSGERFPHVYGTLPLDAVTPVDL